MWQSDRGAIDKWALFVSSLQKISEQLSFPLHEDGPSPHEAEAILLQNVVAVLHYLRETHRVQKYVSLLLYSWGNKGDTIQSCKFKTSSGYVWSPTADMDISPESLHHILTLFLHLCIKTCSSSELLQPAQVCGLPGTLQPDHPPLLPSRPYHDSFKPVPPVSVTCATSSWSLEFLTQHVRNILLVSAQGRRAA